MQSLSDAWLEHVQIVAEIGINHNGERRLAEELIDAAAECGVNAVKFQAFRAEDFLSRRHPGFAHTSGDVFAELRRLQVAEEWWADLRARAHGRGLYFSSSVFDRPSLAAVARVGVDFVKVASAEIDNLPFLAEQCRLSDVFVVSTGMAYLDEVARAVRFLREHGVRELALLECTTSYPAPPESIRLLNIDFLRDTFGLPAGFSDHAVGIAHSVAAAARGACLIEKHFTLDKSLPGPDHPLSADVAEMRQLVAAVRAIEPSLRGNRKAEVSGREAEERRLGRKSVVAARGIATGETISAENTAVKRPGLGVSPAEAGLLYGRRARAAIPAEQWITWEMVE